MKTNETKQKSLQRSPCKIYIQKSNFLAYFRPVEAFLKLEGHLGVQQSYWGSLGGAPEKFFEPSPFFSGQRSSVNGERSLYAQKS